MSYLFGWVSLVVVSLWVSLIAFLWALRNGQFADQGRARYLPLRDVVQEIDPATSKSPRREAWALLGVLLLGLTGLLSVVLLALLHSKS